MGDYKKFCSFRSNYSKSKVLDLSDVTFFHPTTVLPLAALIKREKPKIRYPENFRVSAYLETATDSSRFDKARWNKKSYLPCVPLPKRRRKVDTILQWIYEKHNNGKKCGGENAFKYLIGELVDNIYEHSEFSRSWVMAQTYVVPEYMDICFFDNGITINGCFEKHGKGCTDDYEAILGAVKGVSTKDITRGFGLSTNLKIFTRGIKGQMLIISGKGGFHNLENQEPQFYKLDKPYELTGTMISVRIPYPAPVVDIYEFLEK
jgi:hypothetical protein